MFPDLSTSNAIALDTETSGLSMHTDYIVGFVLTWSPDPADSKYYPIRHEGGANLEAAPVVEYFKKLLLRTDLRVIMHNAEFDLMMLHRDGITVEGPTEDTGINAALINENMKSFSLAGCCEFHHVQAKKSEPMYEHLAQVFGGKADRHQMANYYKLAGDDEVAVDYACGDGTSTFQLWQAQQKELDDQELRRVWNVECRLIKTLHRAKMRGIHVDVNRLDEVQEQIENELAIAEAEVDHINIGSGAEVQAWLEKQIARGEHVPAWVNTEPTKRFPQGKPSFTGKYLGRFPVGQKLSAVRKLAKLSNGFITPLRETHLVGNKVYPSFSQTKSDDWGTVTGRMSSFKPNMQQVPKKDKRLGKIFRRIFIPPPGMTWWEMDYSQCEYRLFAHYSKSETLIRGYNEEGLNMHKIVADMLGQSYDFAKNMNFGILYGMGDKSLAGHLGVSLAEAKEYRARYFQMIPEAKDVTEMSAKICRKHGYIRTLLGRKRRWMNPRKFDYQALNAFCQGGNADIMKLKMVETEDYMMSEGVGEYGFSVHDANEFFLPVNDNRTSEEVRRICEDLSDAPFKHPLRVDMKMDSGSGANWSIASYGEAA